MHNESIIGRQVSLLTLPSISFKICKAPSKKVEFVNLVSKNSLSFSLLLLSERASRYTQEQHYNSFILEERPSPASIIDSGYT